MFIKVGHKSDFPENKTSSVVVDGQEICVANKDGNFYAFDNSCTHAQASLSNCDIENDSISCPLHGARFSIKTGAALSLPAVSPVKTYAVKVDGADVLIDI